MASATDIADGHSTLGANMTFDFIEELQSRIASAAICASTARKMGPAGTIANAREFLAGLDLSKFSTEKPELFKQELDKATLYFIDAMPNGAKYWGSCRKFINIFLRDVVYNQYLVTHFQLCKTVDWLEVPLDRHVAKGLRNEPGGGTLPSWSTVIGLDQHTSNQYQEFAKTVAKTLSTKPVHLDIRYWRRV